MTPTEVTALINSIAALTSALAWPTLAALAFFVFPDKIGGAIQRIKSLKAPGLEFELYEQVKMAAAEVVERHENVIAAQPLDPAVRQDAEVVFNASVSKLQAAIAAKADIAQNLGFTKLTPGRESILRSIVEAVGPEAAADWPLLHWQRKWPEIIIQSNLNGGALTGLRSVGIVDERDRLTRTGAELIRAVGLEVMLRQSQ